MKLFRCGTCKNKFEAAGHGPCPACGSEAVTDAVAVHYLVIDPNGPIKTALGMRSIACQPAKAFPRLPQCTGERGPVTCPRCKESPLYAAHDAAETDQDTGTIAQRIKAEHGVDITQ